MTDCFIDVCYLLVRLVLVDVLFIFHYFGILVEINVVHRNGNAHNMSPMFVLIRDCISYTQRS